VTRRALALLVLLVSFAGSYVLSMPQAMGDVTPARTSYDYNATYGPLKVYDQGQTPLCWSYAHGLGVIAERNMHGASTLGWVDPAAPDFQFTGTAWHGTLGGADHTVSAEQGSVSVVDPAAMKVYLDKAGFATISVYMPQSIYAWDSPSMPTLYPRTGDRLLSGHSLLVVGYTPSGLIVQNSWGIRYGYRGRAILSWTWLADFAFDMAQESYDTYPLLGATRAPVAYTAPPPVPYHYWRVLRLTTYQMWGSDVRHLQLRLSFSLAAANGRFGLYTKGILARRQRALGLPATGVLDAVSARRIG